MKRPSIIADVLNPEPSEPIPLPTAAPPRHQADPASEIVRTSIYISRASHERLREIAFTKRGRVHQLIVEGIDLVLQKHGHSETAKVKLPSRRQQG